MKVLEPNFNPFPIVNGVAAGVPGDLVAQWQNARLRTLHRQLAADRFLRVRGRDRDVVDE